MPLIRVFEIPQPTSKFHFAEGEPQEFIEVDWFRDDPALDLITATMDSVPGREEIADFIKGKRYFNSAKAYLVLHERHSFTIGYAAP